MPPQRLMSRVFLAAECTRGAFPPQPRDPAGALFGRLRYEALAVTLDLTRCRDSQITVTSHHPSWSTSVTAPRKILCWDKVRPLWLFSLVGRARWHTTIFATCFGTVLLRPHSDPYRSGHKSVGAVTASPDLSNPTTSSGQFTGRPLSSLVWTNLGRSPQTFSSVPTSPVGRRGVESGAGYTRGVAVRPISRVIPAVIAGAVGMVAGLGIGLVAASHGSTGTPRGPATTSIASSAQWAGEGPSSNVTRAVTGPTSQYPLT